MGGGRGVGFLRVFFLQTNFPVFFGVFLLVFFWVVFFPVEEELDCQFRILKIFNIH